MTSVVIAAHDEAAVLGRCLDALLSDGTDLDVTVVANGCRDATADVARARGVRVVELPVASKPAALNAGDEVAVGFPRAYLDADIVLSGADLARLAVAVGPDGALAAVPSRTVATAGCPLPVRAYYAVHGRLPVHGRSLTGRGVIVLSQEGRARFDRFPDQIADDLFLDSLFAPEETRQVSEVTVTVAAPRRTRDLLRRLARVRAGNAALRAALPGVRPADRWSWLRDVVLPRPWLAPAAACYVAITLAAATAARRPTTGWGRDDSTRTAPQTGPDQPPTAADRPQAGADQLPTGEAASAR